MVDMLLESLPDQTEFECLKFSICYGADPSVYTPKRVRELKLAAAARQKEFCGKRGGIRGGQKGGGAKGGDQVRGEGQQDKLSGGRKLGACYVCGSTKHLKAN
ncbi:hypothetical protein PC116_g15586 [Phytophthora cactorum]|nr:hypothetical protein PC119_g17737 [Phytophthora cactorum]KAG4236335.1 hypothetical protein PC116_g15586 [Phytophthora cactorum]